MQIFIKQNGSFLSPGKFRLMLALVVFSSHLTRLNFGRAAVLLFFTLSGYWITRLWNSKYSQTKSPYVTFLISRFWRLFPIFFISVIMTLCACFWSHKLIDLDSWFQVAIFAFSNLFILGYALNDNAPVVPAWSLDIEMQFYILAPFMLALMKNLKTTLTILALIGITSGLILGPRFLPCYMFFFAVGIGSALSKPLPNVYVKTGATLAIVLLVGLILSPFRGMVLMGSHPGPLGVYNAEINVIFAILLIPLAMFSVRQPSNSFDRMLGDLSYPVYLFHLSAILLLGSFEFDSNLRRGIFTLFAVAVVLVVSWIAWLFVDHPLNQMRAKWVDKRAIKNVNPPFILNAKPYN